LKKSDSNKVKYILVVTDQKLKKMKSGVYYTISDINRIIYKNKVVLTY